MNESAQALSGKHAVVTGASRGIGACIAAALAAEGAQVSLLGRDQAKLAQLTHELGGTSRAAPFVVDVTNADSVRATFAAAAERFGPAHILINNAGQAASAKFTDTDEALWNRIMAINVNGVFLCTRQVVPGMLKLGFGRIINIASIAGLRGAAYISAYVASKHAVVGLTRSLALELATKNITVNSVCPGYTDTDIVRDAITRIASKTGRTEGEALESLLAANPQHRLIKPEEIAHTVLWLCRPGTESMTGQSIVLAGGEVT